MEEEKSVETLSVVPAEDNSYELSEVSKEKIKKESQEILAKIIEETDYTKTKDLTVLFNINQTKKTMARVNKLNELLDVITDNAIQRFTEKPDNFSNQELLQGLKVVQDMVEKSQKQINGATETQAPLIQINQQTNNIGAETSVDTMSRDSREKVKSAVMNVLKGLGVDGAVMSKPEDVIEVDTSTEEGE